MIRTNTKKNAPGKTPTTFQGRWLVIIVFFIFELLFYTWIRVEISTTGKEISKAQARQKEKRAYQSELIVEKERLSSPERIMTIARDNLDLHTPAPEQIINMDDMP
ncbi:hypothetical protein [Desulfocicer niacini]